MSRKTYFYTIFTLTVIALAALVFAMQPTKTYACDEYSDCGDSGSYVDNGYQDSGCDCECGGCSNSYGSDYYGSSDCYSCDSGYSNSSYGYQYGFASYPAGRGANNGTYNYVPTPSYRSGWSAYPAGTGATQNNTHYAIPSFSISTYQYPGGSNAPYNNGYSPINGYTTNYGSGFGTSGTGNQYYSGNNNYSNNYSNSNSHNGSNGGGFVITSQH
ncbi:MAG: hypothetical protein WCG97_02970 [bacterium]